MQLTPEELKSLEQGHIGKLYGENPYTYSRLFEHIREVERELAQLKGALVKETEAKERLIINLHHMCDVAEVASPPDEYGVQKAEARHCLADNGIDHPPVSFAMTNEQRDIMEEDHWAMEEFRKVMGLDPSYVLGQRNDDGRYFCIKLAYLAYRADGASYQAVRPYYYGKTPKEVLSEAFKGISNGESAP